MDSIKQRRAPYLHDDVSTRSLALDTVVPLVPVLIWALYAFGLRVLFLCALSVITAEIYQYLLCRVRKKPAALFDTVSSVMGLLFAMTLPVSVPYWIVPIGTLMLVLVKEFLGSGDYVRVHPVLFAKGFVALFFASFNTRLTQPFEEVGVLDIHPSLEGVETASSENLFRLFAEGRFENISISQLLTGSYPGAVGEVSGLLLLAGLLYLLVRRVTTWHVPLCFLGTVGLLSYLFPRAGGASEYLIFSLTTGGVLLAAIFLATDYAVSPVTRAGKVAFGILCGALTVLFRYLFSWGEGARMAVLTAGLLSWCLDRFFIPRSYGGTLAWWQIGRHSKTLYAFLIRVKKLAVTLYGKIKK